MGLRCIIIDDEEFGIDTLTILLNIHVPEIKIVAQATRAAEGLKLIEDYKPEIVFLDINMPVMDGFEMLKKLTWNTFKLIFTTAHQEHGLKAIKHSAVDYLLKPIDPKELRIAVDKVIQQTTREIGYSFDYSSLNAISQYQDRKLGINSKEGVEYIEHSQIIYLESQSNYTKIYLNKLSTIVSPKTLREFELLLCVDNQHFMRVHHSYVINLNKVSRYLKDQETIVMMNSQSIPLSKSRRESFFRWLHPKP